MEQDLTMLYTPVRQVVEQADKILGRDGCLNFFAGPTDKNFSGELNYYNVHYGSTHVIGTTEEIQMILKNLEDDRKWLNESCSYGNTHIGGLNCVPETTLNLLKFLVVKS